MHVRKYGVAGPAVPAVLVNQAELRLPVAGGGCEIEKISEFPPTHLF